MVRQSLAAAATAVLLPVGAYAADHVDSPAAIAEPSADIADIYAWMSDDAETLTLAMTVMPFAGEDALFSDAVTYAFHVNSGEAYGGAQTETLVTCQFYDIDAIECWANGAYVVGDPSDTEGVSSLTGDLRVYAGVRNDPFFFELAGFNEVVATVKSVAGDLAFDDEGCPTLDADTANALVAQLQAGPDGAEASDTLAGANVLALVIELDADLVDDGGPVLGVWGSTHRAE